jgi:hypothetical protein
MFRGNIDMKGYLKVQKYLLREHAKCVFSAE